MATNRTRPDEFEKPVPRAAAKKSVVDKVISGALTAGNSMVSVLAGLLASVLVLYSGYVIYDSFNIQYQERATAWDLLQYKPEFIDDSATPLGASDLPGINPEYRAWLTVYDTTIDYPVLQHDDDVYYAWHNIYGDSSLTGAIYMAAANQPDFSHEYNLIYGHHMDNGAMFGRLDDYAKIEGYFDAHRTAIIVSESGVYDVEFFAVVRTDAYESNIYTVGNRKAELMAFLEAVKNGEETGAGVGTEIIHFDEAAAADAEKIVGLSTCANAETSGRLVVFGKMVKRELITVTAEAYNGPYDGQPHGVTVETSYPDDTTIEYSTDGGETWTTTPPTITDAGRLDVQVRATSETHGTAITSATIVITPSDEMDMDVNDPSGVYNGEPHTVTGTPNVTEGTTVEYSTDGGETWSTTPPSFTDVGTYPVTVRATNPNYDTVTEDVTVTITPADGLDVDVNNPSGPYTGEPRTVTGTPNVTEGTTVEYSTDGGNTWSTTPPSFTDVGEYPVTVRATNPNYNPDTKTVTVSITPSDDLDVTVNNPSGMYDGQPHTVTGTPNVTEGTTVRYSTDGGNTWTTTPPSFTDVGEYPVLVEASNPNYETVRKPTTVTITPSNGLTVTGNNPSGPYDGRPHTVTGTPNVTQGTTVEYSTDGGNTWTTTPPSFTEVGDYSVDIRATNPNYVTATTTVPVSITPATDLTLAVENPSGVYDGKPHTVTGTPSIPEGTTVEYSTDGGKTWTTTPPSFTDVGEYPVTVRATNPNYDTVTEDVTVTITPAAGLTVNVRNGSGVYDGKPHSVTGTPNVIEGTTVEYSTDGGKTWSTTPPAYTNVGEYPVAVRATNPNYRPVSGQVILKITPADGLEVAVESPSVVYDGEPHTVTGTPNVTEGTTVEYSTDGGKTWTTTPPSFVDVGVYPVLVRATNPNYKPATQTAVLRITEKPADPDTIDLTIVKVWLNDDETTRPTAVRMVLTGDVTPRTVTLSATNNWMATISGLPADGEYTWNEPEVTGYTQTISKEDDGITVFTNTRIEDEDTTTYNLTINYRYLDGSSAAPSYTASLRKGETFNVASPAISGYYAGVSRVKGVMPGKNKTYNVIYVPIRTEGENASDVTVIDDYGTPLGVNNIYVELGDCFE